MPPYPPSPPLFPLFYVAKKRLILSALKNSY